MPTTSNFGWTTPADTDLVKNGALAIRTLGNGIDSSLLDLKGGTTGQILSKASNTDLDYTWINNDQGDITEVQAGTGISVASGTGPIPVVTNTVATAFDAKGDLVVGTGADTFARLAVGATNGHTLQVDSSTATGLKWAAAAGGKVLQVVSATTTTSASTTSTTFADTGLTASITPSATTSKILVLLSQYCGKTGDASTSLRLFRGATQIVEVLYIGDTGSTLSQNLGYSLQYVDSPSSTSSLTYKTQYASGGGGGTAFVQRNSNISSIVLLEIGA